MRIQSPPLLADTKHDGFRHRRLRRRRTALGPDDKQRQRGRSAAPRTGPALEYSAAPASVCSVDGSSGAVTISAVGTCTITVTAPANANYNQGSATFALTVIEIGTLPQVGNFSD